MELASYHLVKSVWERWRIDSLGLQTASDNQTPYYATQHGSAGQVE